MGEQGLESLIKHNPEDMKRIREKYYPAISGGAITGYNIYEETWVYPDSKISINFLHAHMGHVLQLVTRLSQLLERDELLITPRTLVERYATYATYPKWDTKVNVAYFWDNGKQIKSKQIDRVSDNPVIGESMQNDWCIKVSTQEEFEKVFSFFMQFASAYQMHPDGTVKRKKGGGNVENTFALKDSWQVPLLTYLNKTGVELISPACERVNEVIIPEMVGKRPVVISTLCTDNATDWLREEYPIASVIQKYLIREALNWIEKRR